MLTVTSSQYKRCDLVKATGRVDSQTAPQLAHAFDVINEAGRYKIVFDLSDVDFMSSAGLRVIINTQKTCRRWNRGELVLAGAPRQVNRALELAGLLPLFRVYDAAAEAVGSF